MCRIEKSKHGNPNGCVVEPAVSHDINFESLKRDDKVVGDCGVLG